MALPILLNLLCLNTYKNNRIKISDLMMIFFDYLFYKMEWWNSKVVFDLSPFFSSILIISVFQGFNILFLLNFCEYFFWKELSIIDNYVLIIPASLFILNYFKYNKNKRRIIIQKRVNGFTNRKKNIYNFLTITYFVFSLGILIWIAYLIRIRN